MDPRIIHQTDQLSGKLALVPPLLRAYYNRLVEVGFPAPQAFRLVRDLQRSLLGGVDTKARPSIE